MESIGTWWMWAAFAALVVIAIVVDLLVLESKGAAKVSFKQALKLVHRVDSAVVRLQRRAVVVPRRQPWTRGG